MLSKIYAILKFIMSLFDVFKFINYKSKVQAREKAVEILRDKNATEDDKLRALNDLSK